MTERAEFGERAAAAEAELFKLLGHPARVRVLSVLASGPASVADLCSATGLRPSHLAGQLAQLRAQHLVAGRRDDGKLQYALSVPEIAELISAADAVLNARAVAAVNGFAGSGASGLGPGLTEAVLTDESAAVLEESLERRALITDAVRSVSARTGRSSEQALLGLLAQARERSLTLAEVSSEAVAERGKG
ncbi:MULTISPECIES: ArsR/SmtB family transcription factor [unclassified Arthrobacter]|uniref:ArsR/SmtB family transcription factor n=1 Tax=unclassified Arthrobacter TaxID=235627 RepID=UPI001F00C24C|nr:metalloregulator ArsR/SmtB family transcription factor [Arthrobacter sp. FW305-BF8]UKA53559.1 metalloregulator ArsR/SmtB family transcription factor [Arthrobacter sp. FW305-BF8]